MGEKHESKHFFLVAWMLKTQILTEQVKVRQSQVSNSRCLPWISAQSFKSNDDVI